MHSSRGSSLPTALIALIFVALIGIVITLPLALGTNGFGPINHVVNAVVTSKHVDFSGSGEERQSHYMVNTDKGTFEVNNGWALGIWNADEIYGRLIVGKSYDITTKGNKVVGMFMQQYPYIIDAQPRPVEGVEVK